VQFSWGELEVPVFERRAQVSWAVLEVPNVGGGGSGQYPTAYASRRRFWA